MELQRNDIALYGCANTWYLSGNRFLSARKVSGLYSMHAVWMQYATFLKCMVWYVNTSRYYVWA